MSSDPESSFGRALARRVASPLRQRGPVGMRSLVGAVGRSSLGFGRAVGRAQGIRPVVVANELNSHALRPPAGFWVQDDAEEWRSSPATSTTTSARTSGRASTTGRATTRRDAIGTPTTSGAGTGPVSIRRPSPPPTWTDRLLPVSAGAPQRSPTSVSQRARAEPSQSSLPKDAKFERMRAMFDAKKQGVPTDIVATNSAAAPPAVDDQATSTDGVTQRARSSGADAAIVGERGDTTSGRSTGPGRLGRSMRPAVLDVDSMTNEWQQRSSGSNAPRSSRPPSPGPRYSPSAAPDARSDAAMPRPRTVGRSSAGRRGATSGRMDTIRRLMNEMGAAPLSTNDAGAKDMSGSPRGNDASRTPPAIVQRPIVQRPGQPRSQPPPIPTTQRAAVPGRQPPASDPSRPGSNQRSRDGLSQDGRPTTEPSASGPATKNPLTNDGAPNDQRPIDRTSIDRASIDRIPNAPTPNDRPSDNRATQHDARGPSLTPQPPAAGTTARRTADDSSTVQRTTTRDLPSGRVVPRQPVVEPGQSSSDAGVRATPLEPGNTDRTGGERGWSLAQRRAERMISSRPGFVEQQQRLRHQLETIAPPPASPVGTANVPLAAADVPVAASGSPVVSRAGARLASENSEPGHRPERRATIVVDPPPNIVAANRASLLSVALDAPTQRHRINQQRRPTPHLPTPHSTTPHLATPHLSTRASADGGPLLRRVTLPRVMSITHQPARYVAERDVVRPPTATGGATGRVAAEPQPSESATAMSTSTTIVPPEGPRETAVQRRAVVSEHGIEEPADAAPQIIPASVGEATLHRTRVQPLQRVSVVDTMNFQPRQPRRQRGTPLGTQRDGTVGSPPVAIRRSIVAPGSGALLSVLRSSMPQSSPASHASSQPTSVTDREMRTDTRTVQRRPSRAPTMIPQDLLDTLAPASAIAAPGRPEAAHQTDTTSGRNVRRISDRTDALAAEPRTPRMDPVKGSELAGQFMSELSRTIQRRADPLPVSFRPMAETIAGGRAVLLSTDNASRRALRSVGKVAATTANTIHLDPQPIPTSRLSEVIAHELTHVASPSPRPRFFDDAVDSPEERRAEEVGRAMARSPLNPSASLLTPPSARPAGPAKRPAKRPAIQRRADGTQPSPTALSSRSQTTRHAPETSAGSSGTVSAAAMAARIERGTAAPQTVQRFGEAAPHSHRSPASASSASLSSQTATSPAPVPDDQDPDEWFREQLRTNFSHIMNLIEDRLIEEFERRGGRAWGEL